VTIDDDLIKS